MVLWDLKETLDSKDRMELQDLWDKMEHQDPKVTVALMAYPVRLALLDSVFLELLDLQESRDQWVSLDSQEPGARRVCVVTQGCLVWEPSGLKGTMGRQGSMGPLGWWG